MDAVLSLAGYAKTLKAKAELDGAPQKLQEVVRLVEMADNRLGAILPRVNNEIGDLLIPVLKELGQELVVAQEKIERYKDKSERRKRGMNDAVEVAKAMLGQGVAKQNQSTMSVLENIRQLLLDLDQIVNVKTFLAVSSLRAPNAHRQVPEIISKLGELASMCLDREECTVHLRIGSLQGNEFHPPVMETTGAAAASDGRRAAREGGFEIANSTKIMFEIQVDDDRFFYVVVYDDTEATLPELFFPKSPSAKHGLSSGFKRIFPSHITSKHDPMSFRIEKSAHLGSEGIGQQSVYFLLADQHLHQDAAGRVLLKLEDIQDNVNEEVIVKKFIFDIK